MVNDVLCVILGGGRGTRLYPLTRDRAKPAVPLFGKYRLIDIPVSNCINSGFTRINILTQFNSESLNKHITRTYKFDQFTQGYVDIIAADQTMDNADWFQGPADAVRRCLKHLNDPRVTDVCILSGDQLYKMDLRAMLAVHRHKKADLTVACNLISPGEVSHFGIAATDAEGVIGKFIEKPKDVAQVKSCAVSRGGEERYLCSMGIYFFKKEALVRLLQECGEADFGKHIIPHAIGTQRVVAYEFDGYWRDIGTIASFFHESIAMTAPHPPLDLFEEAWPIFTRARALPPSRYEEARVVSSMVAEGAVIGKAAVKRSIVGLRSRIGAGADLDEVVLMGADYYEVSNAEGVPIGVGEGCVIRRAIIDKNARIGAKSRIVNAKGLEDATGEHYHIREGIVIIHKNAVIEPGTVI
jgi:glucose-1-phosphate adenylyltransferase